MKTFTITKREQLQDIINCIIIYDKEAPLEEKGRYFESIQKELASLKSEQSEREELRTGRGDCPDCKFDAENSRWNHQECIGCGEFLKHWQPIEQPEVKEGAEDKCCKIGDYKCHVETNVKDSLGRPISVDKCLKGAIEYLNEKGFKTIASCCGHGKINPIITIEQGCTKIKITEKEHIISFANMLWEKKKLTVTYTELNELIIEYIKPLSQLSQEAKSAEEFLKSGSIFTYAEIELIAPIMEQYHRDRIRGELVKFASYNFKEALRVDYDNEQIALYVTDYLIKQNKIWEQE